MLSKSYPGMGSVFDIGFLKIITVFKINNALLSVTRFLRRDTCAADLRHLRLNLRRDTCANDICAAKKFLFKPKSELKRRKYRVGSR